MNYRECSNCGARLDPEERCSCARPVFRLRVGSTAERIDQATFMGILQKMKDEVMEVKMGHTAIICKSCGTVTAVENEALEAMREYKCPTCAIRMSDYGLATLKMHYYYLMYDMYQKHWGSVNQYQQFGYDIHLWPHFETKSEDWS